MWHYTAFGTQRCGTIQLWEHRDVALYRFGSIEMWHYTAMGTQRCGTIQLSLSIYIYICVCVCGFSTGSQHQNLLEVSDGVGGHSYRQTDIHTDSRQTDRRAEMRAKCPFRDVTNSGRVWGKGAGKRCLEREQHSVPVPTLTPTSSAGPTKLIGTPHLQFTQLHLVLVTTLTPTSK